ncbi:MAG: pilus assembly protein [Gammaproteobacteria bacterium]|nr:pilus assembly protein [Gammaproteobacteria bacterium]
MACFADKTLTRQRGAVLAEMAIVTPLLIILVLATADLTRAFIEHNTLTKVVRNGARYAAANAYEGTTGIVNVNAALVNETKNLVVFGNVAGAGAAVLPGLALADVSVVQIGTSNDVEVRATYTISGLLGPMIPGFFLGGDVSTTRGLQASVRMRAL